METPARYTFAPDGSTNVFQIPVQMKGDNYIRIDIDDATVNDRNKFDIVNNSVVFVDANDVPSGSKLDILVVQTDEGINNLGNINSVDTVSQNITAVNAIVSNLTAVKNASANATSAQASATAAATSLSNTIAAEMSAIQASADADTAKNAAQGFAQNSSDSATASANQATAAASSATASQNSAINSAASEVQAGNSATASQSSAVASQASATAASNTLNNFEARYLGAKAAAPTLDNEGGALIAGALYYNTASSSMQVYTGSVWTGAGPAARSLVSYVYTATSGQTIFSGLDNNNATLDYVPNNIFVSLNGAILDNGTDFTATDTSTIVMTSGVSAGATVTITSFDTFAVPDAVSATGGGTFSANVSFAAGATATNFTETVVALSGTAFALDPSNGSVQTHSLTANTTYSDGFSSGESMTLMILDGSSRTVSWPTITWVNNQGVAPILSDTTYTVVALWKVNSTLYGALVGDGT